MGNLIEQIIVVDGHDIEFSPEIQERMKTLFDEAVDRESEEHFLDGIETVLNCMVKMGMDGSKRLVMERLVSDGVIEVDDDKEDEVSLKGKQNESRWMDEVVKMIG